MFWEKHQPWLIAVVVVVVLLVADGITDLCIGLPANDDFARSLLSSSINGGAIFTAFLTTTLSFLLGVDSPAARRVLESEYRGLLLSYFKQAIYGSMIFCLLSLAGYYFQSIPAYFYVWLFAGTYAVSAFLRCVRLLFLMLIIDKPKY